MKKTDMARVYDLKTEKITEMPLCELAPGMMMMHVHGVEGVVWVKAGQVPDTPEEPRHPPFEGDLGATVRDVYKTLRGVMSMTFEEWEYGFRCDLHPKREIRMWTHAADTFATVTHGETSPARKLSVFRVLAACMNSTLETYAAVVDRGCLTDAEVKRVAEMYFGSFPTDADRARMEPREPSGEHPAVERLKARAVPVTCVADPMVRRMIRDSDAIIGFDTTSGESTVYFGQDRLTRNRERGVREPMTALSFWVDPDTSQTEYLCAVVRSLRGSCCYDEE